MEGLLYFAGTPQIFMSTERKVAKLKTWLAMFSSIAYNQRLDGVRGPHNQEASNIFCALIRICNYFEPTDGPWSKYKTS